MSNYKQYVGTAWVGEHGDYSYDSQLITFDPNQLTEQQWEKLDTLTDYDRIEYVMAVLDGNDLSEWEDEE